MDTNNMVIMADKDELDSLLSRDLTNDEWNNIKQKLYNDKSIWQVVDDRLKELLEDIDA
jgi:DNA-binding transcriptional regulator GbsR (MarR family)